MSSTSRISQISRFISRSFSTAPPRNHDYPKCPTTLRTSPKKCKKRTPYMFCSPKVEEFPEILTIMERNYYREEPTLKFLGMKLKLNSTLANRIMERLNEGNSLLAKCKYTGRIFGVALNETVKPWDSQTLAKLAKRQECPKTKKLLMFYSYLEGAPKLFDKNPCLFEIFSTTNVFIERGERSYGLGMLLAKKSINLAIQRKYKLLRCDATNFAYSQLLERLKFKLELHIPYETYVDENGEKIFKNVQVPNIGVKIYTLDLSNRPKHTFD